MDLFVLLYEAMAGAIFLLLLVLMVLIPSRKRVLEGRAGNTMSSPLVPIMMIIALLVSTLMIPVAIVLVEKALILVLTSLFVLPASVATMWDYWRTKKLFEEVRAGGRPGAVPSGAHEADELPLEVVSHTPPDHTVLEATYRSGHMAVECPRCRGRIQVQPHQTTLTCPYCGLSGTL